MPWFCWGSCRTTDPIHIVPSCSCAVLNGSSHSPTSLNGAPSTPNGFSNGPAMSSTASLSNQQLPPACGARQLCKLKRFLTTLQQFGNDISPEIGERVRSLVLGLVVSFGMHLFIFFFNLCSFLSFTFFQFKMLIMKYIVYTVPKYYISFNWPRHKYLSGTAYYIHVMPVFLPELHTHHRRVSLETSRGHQLSTKAICHSLPEGKCLWTYFLL